MGLKEESDLSKTHSRWSPDEFQVPPGAAEMIAVTPRSSLAAIVSTRQFCVPTCPPVLVSQAEMMGSWTKTVGEEREAPLQIRTTGNGDLKLYI